MAICESETMRLSKITQKIMLKKIVKLILKQNFTNKILNIITKGRYIFQSKIRLIENVLNKEIYKENYYNKKVPGKIKIRIFIFTCNFQSYITY